VVRDVELSIHGKENIMHQLYNILKNLQRKKITRPSVSKTLKKVYESNKRTNQVSMSEKSRRCTREIERRGRE